MNRKTANLMFRLICLLFSAALAVATLLGGIDLTAESDRITARRAELAALEEENERLRAEAACSLSLQELEDYALHVLGMQPCESRQIEILDIGG